jgi:hypothetical protein
MSPAAWLSCSLGGMSTPLISGSTRSNPRRFEVLTFIVVFLLATQVGFRFIGGYLYLIYTYGFQRVQSEHLHLLKMGKTDPWIVSNGDQIAGGGFPWFLVAAGISIAFFLPAYLLIYRFLPKRKDKNAA